MDPAIAYNGARDQEQLECEVAPFNHDEGDDGSDAVPNYDRLVFCLVELHALHQ